MPKNDNKNKPVSPFGEWVQKEGGSEEKETNKREEYWHMIFDNLFSDDKLYQKGDISPKLLFILVRLKILEERTGSLVAKDLAAWILKYSISKDRKGRKELVQMMQRMEQGEDEDTTYLKKLMGG